MVLFIFWLFSLLFFTCIGFLIFFRINKNKMTIYRRVSPYLTLRSEINVVDEDAELKNKSLYIRFIEPILQKIRHFAVGRMPRHKMSEIEKRLQAAGNPFNISAGDFVLLQVLLPIMLFFLFSVLLVPSGEKVKGVLLAAVAAVFAYRYTNYYLSAKRKQRVKQIDKAMPDFFDLLNVSIEAGMGLDGALKRVCHQMETPLSREFLSALEDMKLGKSRRQAFIELRDRVPSDFFRSVMSSIIQADQMGIGLSKVLRTQTKRIREKQRFTAKEQAMKAPVKMLIPMVLFIFPTLFIVLIGPVIVNLVTQFL
jgi:tight adherence protein C